MYISGVNLSNWYMIGECSFPTGQSWCETCFRLSPHFGSAIRELTSAITKIYILFLTFFRLEKTNIIQIQFHFQFSFIFIICLILGFFRFYITARFYILKTVYYSFILYFVLFLSEIYCLITYNDFLWPMI